MQRNDVLKRVYYMRFKLLKERTKHMELNDSRFEALLKEAVCEYHIEELKAIPSNRELKAAYTLSPEFYRKMDKILIAQEKVMRKYNIIRILKYAAIIVLMIGTLALTNSDVRAKIKEIFFEMFNEYAVMTFNSDSENVITSLEDLDFELGYVPDGFELVEEMKDSNVIIIIYKNIENNEETLIVKCSLNADVDNQIKSDSENVVFENITINNKFEAYFRSSESNNKENYLIYFNSKIGCSVSVMANLSKEELIKLAESITY